MDLNLRENTAARPDESSSFNEFSQPRVLIVDGDRLSAQVVSRLMKTLGAQVDTTDCGVSALNFLSLSRYDAVVTELEMPDISGFVLACWLREKSPDTRVFIMTGRNPAEVEDKVKTKMADGWIYKPFSMSDLETALNHIVDPDFDEPFD